MENTVVAVGRCTRIALVENEPKYIKATFEMDSGYITSIKLLRADGALLGFDKKYILTINEVENELEGV